MLRQSAFLWEHPNWLNFAIANQQKQNNMKEAKIIKSLTNATAATFGPMSELNQYELQLGPEVKIPGKVFGGALLDATGGDFSF